MENDSALTKDERNQIYKLALEIYTYYIAKTVYMGMCGTLEDAIKQLNLTQKICYDNSDYDYLFKELPEFAALKPKNVYHYWWDRRNTKIRIKNFKTLIYQTK